MLKFMEKEILRRLKDGGYLSGEQLAASLGVSRTTVWKYIRSLRRKGYRIHSSSRLGYRLEEIPDLLTPEEIQPGLATRSFGRSIHYFQQVSSTQDEARRLAEGGAEEGTVVVAEAQASGRGRRDRHWFSPPGTGIYLSLILRPELQPFNIAQIPIVVGIGVCEAIFEVTGLRPRLKWPNDVLVDGKKVVGILAEMSGDPERVYHLIVGIGINVNTPADLIPNDLQATATSLAVAAGRPLERLALTRSLLAHLERLCEEFKRSGFGAFKERLLQWDQTIHSWVEVADAGGLFVGYALDIDNDGALVVKDREGNLRRVLAGDATLKQDPGAARL